MSDGGLWKSNSPPSRPSRNPSRPGHRDAVEAVEAVETIFRIESPRVIAGVSRIVRDVGIAEESAQDALVAALEQWPRDGVPDNPGAWLTTTAKRRAIDLVRRREQYARKLAEVGRDLSSDRPAPPRRLRPGPTSTTTCCGSSSPPATPSSPPRPASLSPCAALGGLTTPEIARAFLAPEATVAQRIVRAKRTLAAKGVPFEVPYGPDREARLGSVLEVIYLVFNEGYVATAGDDLLRPALCEDALRRLDSPS